MILWPRSALEHHPPELHILVRLVTLLFSPNAMDANSGPEWLARRLGHLATDAILVIADTLRFLDIDVSYHQGQDELEFRLTTRGDSASCVTSECRFNTARKTWCRSDRRDTAQELPSPHHPPSSHASDCPTSESVWTDKLPQTEHVDFLMSRDWGSTSLGPMRSWPVCLQLMTLKMLADPRPANLYW